LHAGHASATTADVTVRCHHCGRRLDADRIGVRDLCAGCGVWLHCCRNCDFYAPGMARECREPTAERVPDKEQGNFCDHFRPAGPPGRAADPDASRARAALERLFGKKPAGE
jgi:hypothetical protein